jgi:methylmalonyl-CoA/ethylmalonyl-CoA epimerase
MNPSNKCQLPDARLQDSESDTVAIPSGSHGFAGLDHFAIVVPSTEEALKVWRDKLGFPVVCSEVVNGGVVRLTHLDLGNTHLQLVEPLTPDHPLQGWLKQNGAGLHHFCFKVNDVGIARTELQAAGLAGEAAPHQGTQGKRALFLTKSTTQGVQVEVTGA